MRQGLGLGLCMERVVDGVGVVNVSIADRVKLLVRLQTADCRLHKGEACAVPSFIFAAFLGKP